MTYLSHGGELELGRLSQEAVHIDGQLTLDKRALGSVVDDVHLMLGETKQGMS